MNLRAIRDALLPPTLVQREGMSIAAEVIPAEPYVGGDFFFVGDGPRGTVVVAVGDVVGKGIQAARRSAFTRTVLASVASFNVDPLQQPAGVVAGPCPSIRVSRSRRPR